MSDNAPIYYSLFDEHSISVQSPWFHLFPGNVVQFIASNFMYDVLDHSVTPPKRKGCRQEASVHQLILNGESLAQITTNVCGCQPQLTSNIGIIDDIELATLGADCLPDDWTLTSCNNMRLLDIPGVYRLELNDPDMLGVARVYMRELPEDKLNRPSALYFGR
jgi:hypothetical protein